MTRGDLGRLSDVCALYPEDELAAYARAMMAIRLGRPRDVVAPLTAFLQRHQDFAEGWDTLGLAQVVDGKAVEATSSFRSCLKIFPFAGDCLHHLVTLDEDESGTCEEAEALSRTWVTAEPESSMAFQCLARAIVGRGGSLESARDVLAQSLSGLPASARPSEHLMQGMSLDILQGHFDDALSKAAAAHEALAEISDEEAHADLALATANVDVEVGDRDGAMKAMADFFAHRDALVANEYFDYRIWLPRLSYLTGTINRQAFAAARDEWIQGQGGREALGDWRGFEWVMAYAEAVSTEADAVEAVEALPRFLPFIDPLDRNADQDDAIGWTYWRAGDPFSARPFLERAARSCRALDLPLSQTHAHLHLGELLERMKDTQGRVFRLRRGPEALGERAEEHECRSRARALGIARVRYSSPMTLSAKA